MRKHEYRKKRYGSGRIVEYHCKACKFYGTPVTQEEKQNKKEELTEKLLCERVSQRGIARAVRVSRNRVLSHIEKKKSDRSDRSDSEYGSGQQPIAICGRQTAQLPGIGEMKRARS